MVFHRDEVNVSLHVEASVSLRNEVSGMFTWALQVALELSELLGARAMLAARGCLHIRASLQPAFFSSSLALQYALLMLTRALCILTHR